MRLLALDTASQDMLVAILNHDVIKCDHKSAALNTYEGSISCIQRLLRRLKISLSSIDYFAVCVGPGSFTGIRIGMSTMKALAYAQNKPLIGFRSLDADAVMLEDKFCGLLCVMHDARRSNVYSAVYKKTQRGARRVGPPSLLSIHQALEELKNKYPPHRASGFYFYGDGVWMYRKDILHSFPRAQIIERAKSTARAYAMIQLATRLIADAKPPLSVMPLYMYPRDCQVRKHA